MQAPFTLVNGDGPLVSTAIHAGHRLRPEVEARIALGAAERLREEDPYTDLLLGDVGTRVVANCSRFEVDLNRPREESVYTTPDAAWGLDVWGGPLPSDVAERSRALHDDFYAMLAARLDVLADEGPFLVLDVHSYNHRRDGAQAPAADPKDNPEINVGTGALDRRLWGPVVADFITSFAAQTVKGHRLDVRENVRFRGGHLSRWVAGRYPERGCALALEFKKTFMDEWTGQYDAEHIEQLRRALAHAVEPTLDRLNQVVPT